VSNQESLLDTVPGRLFIGDMRSSQDWGLSENLIRAATRAIGRYLYSDGCQEVAHFDPNDPALRQFDAMGLAALARLSTFGSPQIHQGTITELHEPRIGNRDPLSALPNGAFWTSAPITDDEDSWTLCGENLGREKPRWEVHFDVTHVRVAQIDSARDWCDLIDSNTAAGSGCRYPDWPAIGQSLHAVHLSPMGLLLAHPRISTTPITDGSGQAHSEAGPYASVAHWSTVSTAWLREPPNAALRPAPVVAR
jgi:hypothetical protein